jgi:hypothetical protein
VVLRCWSEQSRKRSRLDAATSCLHDDGFLVFPPPSSTPCFSHSTPILYNIRLHLQMLITNSLQDREKHCLFSKITALQIISHQVVLSNELVNKTSTAHIVIRSCRHRRGDLRHSSSASMKNDSLHSSFASTFTHLLIPE